MKFKKLASGSVSLMLTAALIGCGSSGAPTEKGGASPGGAEPGDKPFEGVTLRVLTANHPWTEAVKELVPEFEEETGIKVNMEQFFEDQLSQKLTVELTSGTSSLDIFMIRPLQEAKLYMRNGWLADLSEYAQDEEWDLADYSESSIAPLTGGEGLYGIPLITEREILYYRKDIFAENNLKAPETLDELRAAAEQLNDPANDFYGFVARGQRSPAVTQFSSFLYSSGGDFLQDGKATLDTPEAIEAFKLYGDLLREYGPPGVLNMSWPQAMGVFVQGKVAMFTDADSVYPNMLDPEKSAIPVENIGFALFPAGSGGQKPTNVTAWGLAISSKSKQQEAAWEFVKWVTNKENSLIIQSKGNPGARQSVWDDPEGNAAFPDELAEVMNKSQQIGVGHDRPLVINVGAARDIVGTIITESISGGDVERVAREENAKFQDLIDRE
ncbi:ABC transporter substrate-binding protein [Paenibacillus senegalensis]|uniref:ABC transporter substrate-binding protein n=1 Tax=Paenibacillus senegalensis TaxID=1465766 RepID=UPI00028A261C|nr:sugar ABC transporter substrate-binding protein [Paenibacillus senegalensis]